MNFSDLPENSWEKVMVNMVEHIGGDSGALVKWDNKIPDPVETATTILDMVQYLDPDYRDMTEGNLAKGFRAFYKLGEYEKPEFPKARLIREDFLPEQDSMENYRIKKITKPDGTVWYHPQKKILWFWVTIEGGCYSCENWAHASIFSDYSKRQKDKIEYLPPDSSKTLSKEPPLKLKKSTDLK